MKTNTEATMTPQDSQSELREKLTCIMGGCIGSHENCLYETIEDAEIGSAEETKQMVDMQISLIEAYRLRNYETAYPHSKLNRRNYDTTSSRN